MRGCPACAGIDPELWRDCCECERLPRMRGDRPNRHQTQGYCLVVAPHARG